MHNFAKLITAIWLTIAALRINWIKHDLLRILTMLIKKQVLLLIAISMLISATVSATTLKKMELYDLTIEADLVVRAEALSVEERFDPLDRHRHNYFTLKTEEILKGQAAANFIVRLVAPYRNLMYAAKIVGQPEISVGGDYLLFLRKKDNLYFIIGMIQGQYNLVKRDGKIYALQNKAPGVSLLKANGTVIKNQTANVEMEYETLKNSITAILKNDESKPQ